MEEESGERTDQPPLAGKIRQDNKLMMMMSQRNADTLLWNYMCAKFGHHQAETHLNEDLAMNISNLTDMWHLVSDLRHDLCYLSSEVE